MRPEKPDETERRTDISGKTAYKDANARTDITDNHIQGIPDSLYRGMIDALDHGVGLIDATGTFVLANAEVSGMFGLPKDQCLVNTSIYDLIPKQALDTVIDKTSREDIRQTGFELAINTSSGTKIMEITATPMGDDAGKSTLTLCSFKNISEQKGIENRLRKKIEKLEGQLERQSALLKDTHRILSDTVKEKENLERQLRETLRGAESAIGSRRLFLANMSHEIRTPLHGILSYSRFGIKKKNQADPQKLTHYFEMIEKSGRRLLNLLNNLLDLSILSSNRTEFHFQMNDLQKTLNIIHSEFALSLSEKSIDMPIVWNTDRKKFIYDEIRILQLLRNLVSNALKFSPAGGTITISVDRGCSDFSAPNTTGTSSDNKPECSDIRIAVADEGVGIPDNELETIFEEFTQSSRTSDGAGGTGLGLSICRHIATGHNGSIHAHNREAGGAVFEVFLPENPTGDCNS